MLAKHDDTTFDVMPVIRIRLLARGKAWRSKCGRYICCGFRAGTGPAETIITAVGPEGRLTEHPTFDGLHHESQHNP